MNKFYFLGVFLALSGCYLGDDLPKDQNIWTYSQPSEVGLDTEALYALDDALVAGDHDLVTGLIILKNDQLVFENYYNFSARNQLKPIGKSAYSIIVLILDQILKDGYIQSLDDPIDRYLPEYEAVFSDSPKKREITLKHLLTHKSGISWNEPHVNVQRGDSDFQKMRNTSDWPGYILGKSLEADPGLRFVTNTGMGLVLARIIQNVLPTGELEEYINTRLLGPLGITNHQWETSPDGTLNCANGLKMTTLDFAKIGYLILQEGRWINKQRLIDRDWILEVTSTKVQTSLDYSVGYGWWIFTEEFLSRYLSQVRNTYFLSGEGGQNLYIIPDQQMVVCVMAENYYYGSIFNPSLMVLLKSLEAAQHSSIN